MMANARNASAWLALALLGSTHHAWSQAPPPAHAQPAAPATNTAGNARGSGHGRGPAAEGDWARRYAQQSVGLTQQGGIVAMPGVSAMVYGYWQPVGVLGLGAAVRITTNHFLVEPQLGFAASGPFAPWFTGAGAAVVAGIGLGGVVPVSSRLALSPMGRLTFDAPFNGGLVVLIMGELPFTIFLGRNGYIEPYVTMGTGIVNGLGGLFVIGAGYRLGVVF